MTIGLRFLQPLRLAVSVLSDLKELLVGFHEVAVANVGHRLLHAIGQAVSLVVSKTNGLVIFDAGLLLIAHERIRVAEAELRRDEIGIDLKRGTIVLKRTLKVSGHAEEFSVGILRIGLLR